MNLKLHFLTHILFIWVCVNVLYLGSVNTTEYPSGKDLDLKEYTILVSKRVLLGQQQSVGPKTIDPFGPIDTRGN